MRSLFLHTLILSSAIAPGARAQDDVAEFKKRVSQLAGQRLGGSDASRAVQDEALAFLDARVCRGLTAPGNVSLDAVNAHVAELVTPDSPLGESFRVLPLSPRLYALVANFSLAGPGALRLYAREESAPDKKEPRVTCRLVGQIDRFTHTDFFDESLDLVPVYAASGTEADAIFVTVSGRTDELRTGAFTAWRFHQGRLEILWASDILQNSSYEAAPGAFHVTYCSEPDEQRPWVCLRMVRERYAWTNGTWSRTEQIDVPIRKP